MRGEQELRGRGALATFAWGFVLYLLGVILFGAWVRITGSGAGCGDHWPSCHGQIIPIAPNTKTVIEFTHRVTSGMCGIFGLVLLGWAWAKHRGSRVFYGALLTLIFIVIEALIGAGIVLRELVENNDSVARAIVISLHLVNTLILMAAASLTAWWAGDGHTRITIPPRAKTVSAVLLGIGIVLLIATSMSGAVTALGDTLFPVDPTTGEGLMARVRDDLSTTRHFLVRLRIMHPVVAVVTAAYGLFLGNRFMDASERSGVRTWALTLSIAIVIQVLIGLTNVVLAAPGWVQLLHLLCAQVVWITMVLLTASKLTAPHSSSNVSPAA